MTGPFRAERDAGTVSVMPLVVFAVDDDVTFAIRNCDAKIIFVFVVGDDVSRD